VFAPALPDRNRRDQAEHIRFAAQRRDVGHAGPIFFRQSWHQYRMDRLTRKVLLNSPGMPIGKSYLYSSEHLSLISTLITSKTS
jgi:hypothetical protein